MHLSEAADNIGNAQRSFIGNPAAAQVRAPLIVAAIASDAHTANFMRVTASAVLNASKYTARQCHQHAGDALLRLTLAAKYRRQDAIFTAQCNAQCSVEAYTNYTAAVCCASNGQPERGNDSNCIYCGHTMNALATRTQTHFTDVVSQEMPTDRQHICVTGHSITQLSRYHYSTISVNLKLVWHVHQLKGND
eukprot:198-Heterococcus_DN1.PRE.3